MSRQLVVSLGVTCVLLFLSLVTVIILAVLYHDVTNNAKENEGIMNQPDVKFNFGKAVCKVTAPAVSEASGLCMSRRHPGVLYTHNDSGDKPRIYAFNSSSCQLLATIQIQDADNVDYEDIACGSCGDGTGNFCIYVGDIGSNAIWRPHNTVYRIREPAILQLMSNVTLDAKLKFSWDEYDGETLMVTPAGTLFVVSKSADGNGRLYLLPSAWNNDNITVLNTNNGTTLHLDTFEKNPTGGDISPSGTEVLIKAQGEVFYFYVPDGDYLLHMSVPPARLQYVREPQGESVAWGRQTDEYFTISEGINSTLYSYTRQ